MRGGLTERSSRGREGEKFLIYTGPEGKPGGESRFRLSLKTDGVSRKTQFSVPGGGRGVGRGDLKIPTSSIER